MPGPIAPSRSHHHHHLPPLIVKLQLEPRVQYAVHHSLSSVRGTSERLRCSGYHLTRGCLLILLAQYAVYRCLLYVELLNDSGARVQWLSSYSWMLTTTCTVLQSLDEVSVVGLWSSSAMVPVRVVHL